MYKNIFTDHQILRNCTPPAIDDFPPGLFTEAQRQHGAIVVHALVSIYLFIALAVVCEKFFVPAVDRLCLGKGIFIFFLEYYLIG